ncbi:MAG TPA: zinc ribbon domain-containing protein, partial [Halomonas sp.]|nr:zinc ribbon domain-containing protein [Halomonas sp.]
DYGRKRSARPMRSLLGGILRCPHCSGPMAGRDSNYYGCSVHHNIGPTSCPDYRLRRDLVERRIVTLVRKDLLSPAAASLYEREFTRHMCERGSAAKAKKAKARLAEVEREIQRMIDAIVSMGSSAALLSRLRASERERDVLLEQVGKTQEPKELPDIRGIFKQQLVNLTEALKGEPETARAAMGEIFGRIGLELRGRELWGHMQTSPALLRVAGDAFCDGSGDRI